MSICATRTDAYVPQRSESPETFHFLQAKNDVPLKTDFKPAVKVLSRKPAPKVVARQDPTSGMSQLTVEDDDFDDEDAPSKEPSLTAEEQKSKAQREREEKQRRYEEVRERLFGGGSTAASGSGSSSPGHVTPPKSSGTKSAADGKGNGRGRGKGGRPGSTNRPGSSSASPADVSARRPRQGTARGTGETRQLYDPNETPRQESVLLQRKEFEPSRPETSTTGDQQQPVRAPRGPDGSGRDGHGFGARPNKIGP